MTRARVPQPRTTLTLGGIVGIGLLLRLAWWAYADSQPVSDFEYYRRLAERMLDDGFFGFSRPTAFRTPGYPLVLAALMLVSRSTRWLALANTVIAAALPAATFVLASRLTGRTFIALVAAGIVAINPTTVLYSPVLASEPTAWLLLCGVFVCLTQSPDGLGPSARRVAVAGLLAGAAVLTRPDSLFYLPLAAGLVMFWRDRRASFRALGLFVFLATLVVAPWAVRNHLVVGPGAGLSTLSGQTFYYAHNAVGYGWQPAAATPLAGLHEIARNRKAYELGWAYVRSASTAQLLSDAARGTRWLFDPADNYGEAWSTRAIVGGNADAVVPGPKGERFRFARVVQGFTVALLALSVAALTAARRHTGATLWVLYGIPLVAWMAYGIVFSATRRYLYGADLACAILVAMLVHYWAVRVGLTRDDGQ